MSNFWQRTITGTLFVIVLVGCVLWNKYSFIGLLFVICVLGLWEYATLFKGRAHKPNRLGTVVSGSVIALVWSLANLGIENRLLSSYIGGFLLGSLFFPVLIEVIWNKKPSLKNIGLSYAGIFYINIGLFCLSTIGFSHCLDGQVLDARCYFRTPVLGFFILLWSSDTFAYLTGRAFGKTPLAPNISPKKTWEGSIGGAICTVGISFALFKLFGYYNIYQWVGLSIIIVVFGTFGDLIESKFKRVLGVKDSGTILPGHGGILDRFDSLLFAVPFAWAFLMLMSNY